MSRENINHSQCWERIWRKWEGGGEQMLLRRHVPIFCRDCFLSTRLLYLFLNGPTTFCFSETNCLSLWSMYYCLSIGERRADVIEETRSNLLSRLLFADPATVSLFKWPDYFLFLWYKLSLILIYVLLSQHQREREQMLLRRHVPIFFCDCFLSPGYFITHTFCFS